MLIRRILTTATVALVAAGCTDQTPLDLADRQVSEDAQFTRIDGAVAASQHTGLLSNLPITGNLADGSGTFTGVLNITELAFENGQLLATGTLTGTATQVINGGTVVTQITQSITDLAVDLIGSGPGSSCQILELDIPGGLELDLLGLVVDLAPVNLEIRAERGPGNLLGNLLCALTGLLDRGGPLAGITNLLNQINNLL